MVLKGAENCEMSVPGRENALSPAPVRNHRLDRAIGVSTVSQMTAHPLRYIANVQRVARLRTV